MNDDIEVGDFVQIPSRKALGLVKSHVDLSGPAKYVVTVIGSPYKGEVFPLSELRKAQ